jgi:hypothetical protein
MNRMCGTGTRPAPNSVRNKSRQPTRVIRLPGAGRGPGILGIAHSRCRDRGSAHASTVRDNCDSSIGLQQVHVPSAAVAGAAPARPFARSIRTPAQEKARMRANSERERAHAHERMCPLPNPPPLSQERGLRRRRATAANQMLSHLRLLSRFAITEASNTPAASLSPTAVRLRRMTSDGVSHQPSNKPLFDEGSIASSALGPGGRAGA